MMPARTVSPRFSGIGFGIDEGSGVQAADPASGCHFACEPDAKVGIYRQFGPDHLDGN
jgi:hypothetical protein